MATVSGRGHESLVSIDSAKESSPRPRQQSGVAAENSASNLLQPGSSPDDPHANDSGWNHEQQRDVEITSGQTEATSLLPKVNIAINDQPAAVAEFCAGPIAQLPEFLSPMARHLLLKQLTELGMGRGSSTSPKP
ncbi:hypothetical protein [Mariniblastus fucicola]|uniref:hypothetical protein n=1 Tax=Mariniblastus fucicola TaxID=980251 RepID=UPI0009468854|nr:hypothetical protein [Mariniblastus fucicola]